MTQWNMVCGHSIADYLNEIHFGVHYFLFGEVYAFTGSLLFDFGINKTLNVGHTIIILAYTPLYSGDLKAK